MPAPWRREPPDPIEAILRENRPEPTPDFAAGVLALLAGSRRRRSFRPRLEPGRAVAAVALTAVALVGATVAAGGPTHATKGLAGFVDVGNNTGKPDGGGNDGGGKKHHKGWPGNWQYSIPICHKQKTDNHYEWVLLQLKPHDAWADLRSNPYDFLVTPWRPCPPTPPKNW